MRYVAPLSRNQQSSRGCSINSIAGLSHWAAECSWAGSVTIETGSWRAIVFATSDHALKTMSGSAAVMYSALGQEIQVLVRGCQYAGIRYPLAAVVVIAPAAGCAWL